MKVFLWRYRDNRRNYPGYHLSADEEGCRALLAWLKESRKRSQFCLQAMEPAVLRVPNNQGGLASYVSFMSLEIHLDSELGCDMKFSEVGRRLVIRCSQEQIEAINKGSSGLGRGRQRCGVARGTGPPD